ncbi:MAG TPA: FAD-dependent oxidoreductase, partial [Thermoguttaceae bacterium]|nr:FAD-dependent oxidoreductase [Thermoguttaceae bacterium]
RDVVERRHADAVAHGGWSMDLHPADGVYSTRPACNQWHAKGVYSIPYRTLYSRNVENLFFAGRITSASHVAFGSTRVMATCAHAAQAVGMAAELCRREGVPPAALTAPDRIARLQLELARTGQFIPGYVLNDPDDLARRATITATSRLLLAELPADGPRLPLEFPRALLLPVRPGRMPRVAFCIDAARPTRLVVNLRVAAEPDVYTPERTLAVREVDVPAGRDQTVWVDFDVELDAARYVFVCLGANPDVSVHGSSWLVTGVTTVAHRGRAEVTAGAVQSAPPDLGVDSFEFWRPLSGDEGANLAMRLDPPLDVFGPEAVANGLARPTSGPNAWVADPADPRPTITLRWPLPRSIERIELTFDTDRDNPLFSVQYEHPERIMPQCVREYRILDASGKVLAQCAENHQTRNTIRLDRPVRTDAIQIELAAPSPHVPAALHEVRCYSE